MVHCPVSTADSWARVGRKRPLARIGFGVGSGPAVGQLRTVTEVSFPVALRNQGRGGLVLTCWLAKRADDLLTSDPELAGSDLRLRKGHSGSSACTCLIPKTHVGQYRPSKMVVFRAVRKQCF